jgi:nitrate reductase (cytochrome), electron transfer subunit
MRKILLALSFAALTGLSALALAQTGDGLVHGLRGTAPLDREPAAPVMPKMNNDDQKRTRAFAMQPPVIPHQIENYQVDRNFNKCMSCHARDRVGESQAPMVSVTHYIDRDNNFRSEISPRRYFCNQCHVPQMEVKVPVGNTYQDVNQLATARKGKAK